MVNAAKVRQRVDKIFKPAYTLPFAGGSRSVTG